MTQEPELRVRFTRRADGAVVLQCVRRDGSATWQRHDKQASFFSFHDLSHFAVETRLGFRHGFYGLIADGWTIDDTSGKGPRGKLPAEANLVEHVVGLFAVEPPLSADDFNAQLANLEAGRTFSDEDLAAVHKTIRALHGDWIAVAPGSTLELSFDRTSLAVR
jgi:hypothetical protein